MQTAHEEADRITSDLITAVHGFDTQAEAAWNAAEAAASQATTDCDALESSLEATANEGVEALEAEGSSLERACSSLADELTTIYENLAQVADAEQKGLGEAIQTAAQAAAGDVATSEQERLEQPAQALEEDALAPFSAELAQLAATLSGAAVLSEALPPLSVDLGKCQAVVGKVDESLQAMAG